MFSSTFVTLTVIFCLNMPTVPLSAIPYLYAALAEAIKSVFSSILSLDNRTEPTDLLTQNSNARISRLMIDSYLSCINDNDKTNGSKVGIFENAQNFLLISIGLIQVFTFLVILAKFVVV